MRMFVILFTMMFCFCIIVFFYPKYILYKEDDFCKRQMTFKSHLIPPFSEYINDRQRGMNYYISNFYKNHGTIYYKLPLFGYFSGKKERNIIENNIIIYKNNLLIFEIRPDDVVCIENKPFEDGLIIYVKTSNDYNAHMPVIFYNKNLQ